MVLVVLVVFVVPVVLVVLVVPCTCSTCSTSQQLQVVFSKKKSSPIFFATKVNPPNNTWVSE